MKNEKNEFAVLVLLLLLPERSARRALHGPCNVLFATSRIQKPMTKMMMARVLTESVTESPAAWPMSAA